MPSSDEDHSEAESFEQSDDDCQLDEDPRDWGEVSAKITKEVAVVARKHQRTERDYSIPSARVETLPTSSLGNCAIILTFDVNSLSEHQKSAWELSDISTISVAIDNVNMTTYRNHFMCPTTHAYKNYDTEPSHFTVGVAMANTAVNMLRNCFQLEDGAQEDGTFLCTFYEQLLERFNTIAEYCFICGLKLIRAGMMPTICDRQLCTFQYHQLNMFEGTSIAPRVSSDVFSMLLFAFFNATKSSRPEMAMQPAPSFSSQALFLNEIDRFTLPVDKVAHFRQYRSIETAWPVLEYNMPCPSKLMHSADDYAQYRENFPEISKFAEWLIICNNAYIERIPEGKRIDFLGTEHQYIFVNDSKEKQAEFDALVAANQGKTKFFFHGSPPGNWHSIIRRGLKNMSGTNFQLHGAAHGKGIYLAPELSTSLGYSTLYRQRQSTSDNTGDSTFREACLHDKCCLASPSEQNRTGWTFVALVEVVDVAEAYTSRADWCSVVKEEKWATIRMMLLYDNVAYGDDQWQGRMNDPAVRECRLRNLTDEKRAQLDQVTTMFRKAI